MSVIYTHSNAHLAKLTQNFKKVRNIYIFWEAFKEDSKSIQQFFLGV